VDHGLRSDSGHDVALAEGIARTLGVPIVIHEVHVDDGPNLEARARAARFAVLPAGVLTGHTADDQAETVLLRLVRGVGLDGLAAMRPGPQHPLLRLRRTETHALCAALGLAVATDRTNGDPRFLRNRMRHEVLPLLDDVAGRDVVPLLARVADLVRDDAASLDALADAIDPTDALAVRAAPIALSRRALRRWLTVDGYPPDAAALERVLEVVRGERVACELPGGRRVERSNQRLRVVPPAR
jgi:tRNA(Ile)-lysidine synthase